MALDGSLMFGAMKYIDQTDKDLIVGYLRRLRQEQNDTKCPESIIIVCAWSWFRLYSPLMDLKEDLLSGIIKAKMMDIDLNYILPMIQTEQGRDWRDIMMTMKSKECRITSYCVAALQSIDPNVSQCQVFIVSTPEYVQYIRDILQTLMINMGCDLWKQIIVKSLQIAMDMIHNNSLRHLKLHIMEDLEVLLSEDNKEITCDYFRYLPSSTQVITSSDTTLSDSVMNWADRFMRKFLLLEE